MSEYWMRWVDFTRLTILLRHIVNNPGQLTPTKLQRIVSNSKEFLSTKGSPLGKSSMYHHRRNLEKLGLIRQIDGCYVPALLSSETVLLDFSSKQSNLSSRQRAVYADRVIQNSDCYNVLWRVFSSNQRLKTVNEFIKFGKPVILNSIDGGKGHMPGPVISLVNQHDNTVALQHYGYNARQAIHFGMRNWGVKQLCFLDELFQHGKGFVLFPVDIRNEITAETIENKLISRLCFDGDWAMPRVSNLMLGVATALKVRICIVHKVLRSWLENIRAMCYLSRPVGKLY